jgi:hypothetical protein
VTVRDLWEDGRGTGHVPEELDAWGDDVTRVADEVDGLVPDPTSEPDGRWLRTVDGAYVLGDPPAGGEGIVGDGNLSVGDLMRVKSLGPPVEVERHVTSGPIVPPASLVLGTGGAGTAFAVAGRVRAALFTVTVPHLVTAALCWLNGSYTAEMSIHAAHPTNPVALAKVATTGVFSNVAGTNLVPFTEPTVLAPGPYWFVIWPGHADLAAYLLNNTSTYHSRICGLGDTQATGGTPSGGFTMSVGPGWSSGFAAGAHIR